MARRPGGDRDAAVAVAVADRQRYLCVAAPWLERIARRALMAEGVARADISITLVDDRRIGRLHGEWFGDPSATDVITFPLSAPGSPVLEGDIVVSAETVRRHGRTFGWAPRHELAYCVVHGILHLTGHDDTAPGPRRVMRARERAVMRAVGLPAPPRRPPKRRPA